MCIFESDTVKSDCPVQIFREIMIYLKISYRLLVYLTSLTVCSGDIKRKLLKITGKKSSEYELSSGHFHIFFSPPTLNLKKIP